MAYLVAEVVGQGVDAVAAGLDRKFSAGLAHCPERLDEAREPVHFVEAAEEHTEDVAGVDQALEALAGQLARSGERECGDGFL